MTKAEFWIAFERYIPELEELLTGKRHDYTAYNAISADLRAYNEYLVPEITGGKDGEFILIISCDGFRQGSPAVEELTEGVTDIRNWTVVKYRQPGGMDFIPVKGRKVYRKDMLLTWEKQPNDQYALTFYFKWHQDDAVRKTGAMLHLDHTIGEYAAMTRIQGVVFKSLPMFGVIAGLKTLDELKTELSMLK